MNETTDAVKPMAMKLYFEGRPVPQPGTGGMESGSGYPETTTVLGIQLVRTWRKPADVLRAGPASGPYLVADAARMNVIDLDSGSLPDRLVALVEAGVLDRISVLRHAVSPDIEGNGASAHRRYLREAVLHFTEHLMARAESSGNALDAVAEILRVAPVKPTGRGRDAQPIEGFIVDGGTHIVAAALDQNGAALRSMPPGEAPGPPEPPRPLRRPLNLRNSMVSLEGRIAAAASAAADARSAMDAIPPLSPPSGAKRFLHRLCGTDIGFVSASHDYSDAVAQVERLRAEAASGGIMARATGFAGRIRAERLVRSAGKTLEGVRREMVALHGETARRMAAEDAARYTRDLRAAETAGNLCVQTAESLAALQGLRLKVLDLLRSGVTDIAVRRGQVSTEAVKEAFERNEPFLRDPSSLPAARLAAAMEATLLQGREAQVSGDGHQVAECLSYLPHLLDAASGPKAADIEKIRPGILCNVRSVCERLSGKPDAFPLAENVRARELETAAPMRARG